MTCKLNGLFSLGEDFDDEDLLGTDWTACSASATAAVSSGSLRASSAAHREPEKVCHQQTGGSSSSQHNGLASLRSTHTDAAQTVSAGLRQLSHAAQTNSTPPPALIHPGTNLAAGQSRANTKDLLKPGVAEDEFDDWDVDLADLDECDSRMGQPPKSAATVEPLSSAKTQQCSTSGWGQTTPHRMLRGFSTACKTSGSSGYVAAPRNLSVGRWQSPNPCMSSPSAPPRSPSVFPGLTATSPAHSSLSRTLRTPQQQQRPRVTPHASPQSRCLFETVSPGSSSVGSSALSPHPLHAPFLTNRLVQLVSASNKLPKKRPRSEAQHPRTRRFPGPAGLLPQQPQTQNLDQIVVSVPQTPAHGVVARLPSQGSCSQPEEDEFGAGGWAAMKAEMGLDERNPSCFLHTYSVVMVLRKAALKQLTRNKVPNMAVLLKSLVHTHADAKAVFKDPTGEIQGTVHRRLLDDRADELKVGAVLLLKQVGVFSPSHRNHYLNVTPNNLLGIYAPDGVRLASSQLPALVLDPMSLSAAPAPAGPQEPVSQMQLLFDEEDDDGREVERRMERDGYPAAQTHTENEKSTDTSRGFQETGRNPSPQDAAWDADDDLDELLGEMSEDTYSL